MILNDNPKRNTSIFTLVCIALLTLALLPAWSAPKNETSIASPSNQQTQPAPPAPRYTPEEEARFDDINIILSRPVSIEFNDIHVQDIINFFCDVYNINIALDYSVIHPAHPFPLVYVLPMDMENVTLEKALLRIAESGNLSEISYIDPQTNQKYPCIVKNSDGSYDMAPVDEQFSNYLKSLVTLKCKGNSPVLLHTLLEALSEQAGTRFLWNPPARKHRPAIIGKAKRIQYQFLYSMSVEYDQYYQTEAYVTDGYIASILLKNITLLEALEILTKKLGLIVKIEPDFVWITSADKEDSVFGPAKILQQSDASLAIQKQLEQNISLQFERTHLFNICKYITQTQNINFILDNRAIPPTNFRGQTPPPSAMFGSHYPTDGYVHCLIIKNCPIKSALQAMLRAMDLDYAIMNDYIWISDRESIAKGDLPKSLPDSF